MAQQDAEATEDANNGEMSHETYEAIYGTSHEDNSEALNEAIEALTDDLVFEEVPLGVEVWRVDHYDHGVGLCVDVWGGHPKEDHEAEIFDPIPAVGSRR